MRDTLTQAKETYWAEQVTIQKIGASAWLAWAEGKDARRSRDARAADREDRTEKSAVTPGPLAPARELLGEMLLEVKQPRRRSPSSRRTTRSRTFRARGPRCPRCVALSGDQAACADLLQSAGERFANAANAPGRPELEAARTFAPAR